MSWIAPVGWSAGAVLVALWLVVSFMAPGRRRETVEWLAATSMYVALLMVFTNLVLTIWNVDAWWVEKLVSFGISKWVPLSGFGFLWLIFAGGLLVSLFNTLRSLRGPGKEQLSATH